MRRISYLMIFLTAVLLTACGGGGGLTRYKFWGYNGDNNAGGLVYYGSIFDHPD